MIAQFVRTSLLLAISIMAIWLWSITPALNIYNLQLTGVFMLLYFVTKKFSRSPSRKSFDFTSTVILNSICLLLIFSTGGATSSLFFLLDFLLITIALLIEPGQAVVASVLLASLFLWQEWGVLDTARIINILSLLLMTPVAIIFSNNYLENLKSQGRIQVLEDVLQEEETESLLWISKAKPSIATVLNSTTDLVMYFNSKSRELLLPAQITEKLRSIQSDLITLYTSTGTLQKAIEEESDKVNL